MRKFIAVVVMLVMVLVPVLVMASDHNDHGNGNGGNNQNINQNRNTNRNNTNRNDNENTNVNLNLNRNSNRQSQGQGQLQGQRQNQGQGQSQGQSAVGIGIGGRGGSAQQGQSQGSTTSDNTQTMNQGDQGDVNIPRQAPPAIAPNLVAAPETCMGSAAVGASTPFGGVSFGTTYKSEDCELRMYARSLMSLGQPEAALALLAQNEKVAAALRKVGSKAAWLIQEKDRTVTSSASSPMAASVSSTPPSRDAALVVCKTGESKIRAGNGEWFCR